MMFFLFTVTLNLPLEVGLTEYSGVGGCTYVRNTGDLNSFFLSEQSLWIYGYLNETHSDKIKTMSLNWETPLNNGLKENFPAFWTTIINDEISAGSRWTSGIKCSVSELANISIFISQNDENIESQKNRIAKSWYGLP